jgi:hypothetical protein
MNNTNSFRWTNKSVLALAGREDPITASGELAGCRPTSH